MRMFIAYIYLSFFAAKNMKERYEDYWCEKTLHTQNIQMSSVERKGVNDTRAVQ